MFSLIGKMCPYSSSVTSLLGLPFPSIKHEEVLKLNMKINEFKLFFNQLKFYIYIN